MLNIFRALKKSIDSSPPLPTIPALGALYRKGLTLRKGEVIMIAGHSGSQKSGFALWLCTQWALPTLYFAADMTNYEAAIRLACSTLDMNAEEVHDALDRGGRDAERIEEALSALPITIAPGKITWKSIDTNLGAFVEIYDEYPSVIVIDNLMDVEDGTSEYAAQMDIMGLLVELARSTGATVLVLHHCSEKRGGYVSTPPPRDSIKNGMTEKPQCILTINLDPFTMDFKVAIVKQRMGPAHKNAQLLATIKAEPEKTRFHEKVVDYLEV